MRVAVPLLTSLALLLTGCGSSGAGEASAGSAANAVPVSQSCEQLAPDGGIGVMQDVTDYTKELSEVEDYETAMATSDRARDLVDTFDPIIATADDSIRPHLEAVAAIPRTIVDAEDTGNQNLNLEFSGFADAGSAVLDTCFSDAEGKDASGGDSAALIGRDTSVEAYCGDLVDGYKIDSPSTDVTTFGQAWDLIADGKSCDTHDGETYDFAFEGETDADGNRVPREEFRAPVEEMWEGFDDAEDAEEKVAVAIDMCLYRPDDPLGDKGTPGGIRHYGSSLALCPDHPQSEQRRELLEYLPQAQAEFDQVLEDAAEEDDRSSAEPSAEPSSGSGNNVTITGDYAADLAAIGVVPDDVAAYREFQRDRLCEAHMGRGLPNTDSMWVAVRLGTPESIRLAIAYDCPDRMDDAEEALAEWQARE